MLIRIDDYPYDRFCDKISIVNRDNLWNEFIYQLDLPCCVGIIPGTCSLIEINQLKHCKVEIEIAAHGLYHKRDEFDGIDCYNNISLMKRVIEQNGIHCDNFIAPYNKLTEKMTDSLNDLKFRIVQGHRDYRPLQKYNFKYMPFKWYGISKDFLDYDFSKSDKYDILTLHLPWEEENFNHHYLYELKKLVQKYVIPWSEII